MRPPPVATAYSHHGFGRNLPYQADRSGVVDDEEEGCGPGGQGEDRETVRRAGEISQPDGLHGARGHDQADEGDHRDDEMCRPAPDQSEPRDHQMGVEVAEELGGGEEAEGHQPRAGSIVEHGRDGSSRVEHERDQQEAG